VLVEWNDTRTEYPRERCVHQMFEAQVERTPDAVAVDYEGVQLTYRELNRRANQLAHLLRARGVVAGTMVGLSMERSLELVVGMVGILKAGGAYVPLDPTYPAERLVFMLEDVRAPVVVTQRRLVEALPQSDAQVVCVDADWAVLEGQPESNPGVQVPGDALIYVIYTSGSTGRPKGVCIPHKAVLRLVINTNFIQLTATDRMGQMSNTSFDAATFEVWGALLHGARLVGVSREVALSPAALAEQIRTQEMSVMFVTTALFNQLASEAPETFGSMRQLHFGGEAVDPKSVRRVLEKGGPGKLMNAYGPTEVTTFATWHQVEAVPEGATTVPIGRPLANTTAYVLDMHQQLVPPGVPGELYLGGDGLAWGYLNRPELTAEKFVPNPFAQEPGERLYRTGDLVRCLLDGSIEFVGRVDTQVKIRGFRIELGEVEAALLQHPEVSTATVIVREDVPGSKRLVGYVVPKPGQDADVTVLRAYLKERLPDYMVPSAFVSLAALPLTPNGKVDRRALPAPDLGAKETEEFVEPRTEMERKLAEVWASVLNQPRISVHDNFFELGGDSIVSMQIVAQAHQVGLKVTSKQLFRHQTIAELAPVVVDARGDREQGVVQGPVTLTPIQKWLFEQELPRPQHFNMVLMLEVEQPVEPVWVEEAVQALVEHHDALRLSFRREGGGWRQVNEGVEKKVRLERVDVSKAGAGEREAIEQVAMRMQQGLVLEE
ncbi:amino acid adenylation domain-containing protein, partial [Archangium sp.]|uniref:non-ribosomal peptide synthetase n=1 Tax=Archangium sp. TaxID=1872627 RepID=UPI002D663618